MQRNAFQTIRRKVYILFFYFFSQMPTFFASNIKLHNKQIHQRRYICNLVTKTNNRCGEEGSYTLEYNGSVNVSVIAE